MGLYRTSKYLLSEGGGQLQLAMLNIKHQFIYPTLMARTFFGDFREWETWSKLVDWHSFRDGSADSLAVPGRVRLQS